MLNYSKIYVKQILSNYKQHINDYKMIFYKRCYEYCDVLDSGYKCIELMEKYSISFDVLLTMFKHYMLFIGYTDEKVSEKIIYFKENME